jgi:hypothetical protein
MMADAGLVRFACGSCGQKLSAKPEMLGRHCACPRCKAAVVVAVAIDEAPRSPAGETTWDASEWAELSGEPEAARSANPAHLPPMPAPPTTEYTRLPDPGSINAVLGLATVVCLIVAFVNGCIWGSSFQSDFHPSWEFQHRFKTDNAVGATANAVEYLAYDHTKSFTVVGWVIAAILCQVVAAVRKVRGEIQQLRLSPRRGDDS